MEHVETLVQTAEATHREPRRPQAVPGGQASSPSGEGRKDTLCLPNTPLDLGVYRDHCDLGAERALSQPTVLREPPASLLAHKIQPAPPLGPRTTFITFSRYFLHRFLRKIPRSEGDAVKRKSNRGGHGGQPAPLSLSLPELRHAGHRRRAPGPASLARLALRASQTAHKPQQTPLPHPGRAASQPGAAPPRRDGAGCRGGAPGEPRGGTGPGPGVGGRGGLLPCSRPFR